ncbi:Flavodoxin 1 [hydrothermal vent metagenome]|uniref:Flavodoxin 1 n=1 Tax=hydrothermal vent metagenome TaxID=652676 RepID=A0A3B0T877_9ZZZZ
MSKTCIIYSFNSNKTKLIAEIIADAFGEGKIEKVNAETITEEQFLSFDNMILGVPTWFDGELPNYWSEFVPALEDLDLQGKTFAIFGLGDQEGYPENFVDGIGILAKLLEERGGRIVGETPTEGYTFESSAAVRDGKFLGLALDQENQARLTNGRVAKWVESLHNFIK